MVPGSEPSSCPDAAPLKNPVGGRSHGAAHECGRIECPKGQIPEPRGRPVVEGTGGGGHIDTSRIRKGDLGAQIHSPPIQRDRAARSGDGLTPYAGRIRAKLEVDHEVVRGSSTKTSGEGAGDAGRNHSRRVPGQRAQVEFGEVDAHVVHRRHLPEGAAVDFEVEASRRRPNPTRTSQSAPVERRVQRRRVHPQRAVACVAQGDVRGQTSLHRVADSSGPGHLCVQSARYRVSNQTGDVQIACDDVGEAESRRRPEHDCAIGGEGPVGGVLRIEARDDPAGVQLSDQPGRAEISRSNRHGRERHFEARARGVRRDPASPDRNGSRQPGGGRGVPGWLHGIRRFRGQGQLH